MNKLPVADILELPVAERLQLLELIWDSITEVPDAVPLSPETKADLEARLAVFDSDPASGSPWEEVRERILKGTWRTD